MRLIIDNRLGTINVSFDNCSIIYNAISKYIRVHYHPNMYCDIVDSDMIDEKTISEDDFDFFCRAFMDRIQKMHDDCNAEVISNIVINDRLLKAVALDCGMIWNYNEYKFNKPTATRVDSRTLYTNNEEKE